MKTAELLTRGAEVIEVLADAVHGEFCSNGGDPIHCTDISKGRGCAQFLQLAREMRERVITIELVGGVE